MLNKKIIVSLVILMLFTVVTNIGAQTQYPEEEIMLIVPFGAGGGTDGIARTVASEIEKELGTSIVVVNKTSAGGIVGINEIANSKADGYTLGVFSNTDIANFVYEMDTPSIQFDLESFTYLAGLNETGNLLITPKNSDIENLEDFANKSKGGSVIVAIPSKTQKLDVQLIEQEMGIDVTEVVYDGGSKVLADLLGGHIDSGILSAKFAEQAKNEGLNILGLMLSERLETFPEIPTFAEQGYKISNPATRMLVAPKGVPEEIVKKIESALTKAYENNLSKRLLKMGEAPVYRNVSEQGRFLEEDFQMRKELSN